MSRSKDSDQNSAPLFQGEDHSAPYPVSRLAPGFGLVDLAREIEQADEQVSARANAQLQVIAAQMKSLQSEALKILQQAQQDQQLNHARCAFTRVPGRTYHLYRRANGELEFSMLAPRDWGGKPPHDYVDSYQLGLDMRWTPIAEIGAGDSNQESVNALLQALKPAP